jgi:hypothetical protein
MSYPLPSSVSTFLIAAVPVTLTVRTLLRSVTTGLRNRTVGHLERTSEIVPNEVPEASSQFQLPPNVINAKSLL